MKALSRLILVLVTAAALTHAQAAGGRLRVVCIDGSPCPIRHAPKAKHAESCCAHATAKTKACHEPSPAPLPLPPQCIVRATPTVQLSKPAPADAPKTPLATLAPAAAPVDRFAPTLVVSRVVPSDESIPTPAPPVAVHGPRAPPTPLTSA